MLSNVQIEDFLFPLTKSFRGVFSSDNIPPTVELKGGGKKFSLICNLSKEREPGTHFVTVLCPVGKQCVYYVDSFGLPPPPSTTTTAEGIEQFLKALGKTEIIYSTSCVQHSLSTFCGYFAILFVLCNEYGLPLTMGESTPLFVTKSYDCNNKKLLANDEKCLKLINSFL